MFFSDYHFNLKSTTSNRYDILLAMLQTFFKAILYGNKLMYLKSMKTPKSFYFNIVGKYLTIEIRKIYYNSFQFIVY